MNEIETLKKQIEDKQQEIDSKQKEIDNFDRSEYASYDGYDDLINSEGYIKVWGMEFSASDIIKNLDPTAYRTGFNDYVDSLENEEFEEYTTLVDDLETLEDELLDLEGELEDLENDEE